MKALSSSIIILAASIVFHGSLLSKTAEAAGFGSICAFILVLIGIIGWGFALVKDS